MTVYEHWDTRASECEENCREATDSYMKTMWAKLADFCQSVIGEMTVEQAEREWEATGECF